MTIEEAWRKLNRPELSSIFQDWYNNKHSLTKWLALAKQLAELIDSNIPYALELRDACIESTK